MTGGGPGHRWSATLGRAGLIAVGGAIGATTRAVLERTFPAEPGGWPWTTFLINISGSLILGALLEILLRSGPDAGWRRTVRLGCGTGILGGYTTYSSFAVEVVRLAQDGRAGIGIAYALVSVALGLLAALAGILVVTAIHRGRVGRSGRTS